MKQTNHRNRLLYLAVLGALTACGGGSGGGDNSATPNTPTPNPTACSYCANGQLAGTAASGAALAQAYVVVRDASGQQRDTIADANGRFLIATDGLSFPVLLQATGRVGGRPITLHSLATSSDVGENAIAVTPLTELIVAIAIGDDPAAAFESPSDALGKLAGNAEGEAAAKLKSRIGALLTAYGAQDKNLRTTEFQAGDAGLDALLDAISLSALRDDKDVFGYRLNVRTSEASITLFPNAPAGDALSFDSAAKDSAQQAQADMADIASALRGFVGAFAPGVPSEASLREMLAADIYFNNGLDFPRWLDLTLTTPPESSSLVGATIGTPVLEKRVSPDHYKVSALITPANHLRPYRFRTHVLKRDGKWLLAGNHLTAAFEISITSRLVSSPLTESEVAALPGMTTQDSGVPDMPNYMIPADGAAPVIWFGNRSDDYFGYAGWAGDEYDNAATPEDERAQRRLYARQIAHPNSNVTRYLTAWISSGESDSLAESAVFSGPGLPAGGLRMVRGGGGSDHWIYQGDQDGWSAFNTSRCPDIARPADAAPSDPRPVIANCGLDFTKVRRGTEYTLRFYDAAGGLVGEERQALDSAPPSSGYLLTHKSEYFPQLQTTARTELLFANVYDDSASSPFADDATLSLSWSNASSKALQLDHAVLWRQASNGPFGQSTYRRYETLKWLQGTQDSGISFTFNHFGLPYLTQWMSIVVGTADPYGNTFEHELTPFNPR